MKQRQLLKRALMVCALTLTVISPHASADAGNTGSPRSAYDFPIKPGTADWARLGSHRDMVDATRVPDRVIAAMSSEALLQLALDHPLNRDIYAFDSDRVGFVALVRNNDALRALLARADVADVALRAFERLDLRSIERASSEMQADMGLRVHLMSLVLAEPATLEALVAADENRLREAVVRHAKAVRDLVSIYGADARERMARLGLDVIQASPTSRVSPATRRAMQHAFDGPNPEKATLVARAEKGLGLPPAELVQDAWRTVYTPRGTAVSVYQYSSDISSTQKTANANYVKNNYPNATIVAPSTRYYNCHSYAWYSASSSNPYWMNTPQDDKYWTDGSWRQSSNFWQINSRLSWRSDDHSGVVHSVGLVQSKWGQLPLMRHAMTYTPYDDSNIAGWYIR